MIPDKNNQEKKFMETKKINALVYGSQLKKLAEKVIETMEDPNNYNKFAIKKLYLNIFKFKTTYTGKMIYWEYIYDLYCEINDIFENNDFESFAKRCKLAKDYLDKSLKDLTNLRDLYFEYCYEDWIEMKKKEAEYEKRELSDEEIDIENFYENIYDVEYTENYENYNNISEALYLLTEAGEEFSLPNEIIYLD